MPNAPIALFVYNRPAHTKKTIEALQLNPGANESDLYIFSDAAKHDSIKSAVMEVRAYINQVTGFNAVKVIERDFNWGLADSIIDGVTTLCEQYGSVIVLEDDLIVSASFLNFMNLGLEKYKFEDSVMQIAGYMFPANLAEPDQGLFLPFPSSWGWATWGRAWKHFDQKALGYDSLKKNSTLIKKFNLDGRYNYFLMLERYVKGEVDSWAIRWHLTVFIHQGLVLYPGETLVNNIGFDGSGVNCIASVITQSKFSSNIKNIRLPENIAVSSQYNNVINAIPKKRLSITTVFNYFKMRMKKINLISKLTKL